MSIAAGVLLSLLALVAWGAGDFLIQRTTRLVGSAKALFFIGIVGFACLTPFVLVDLGRLSHADYALLGILSFVVILGAAFDFEALRQGKMAIVEPVVGLELPITVVLTVLFLSEQPEPAHLFWIALVFIGTGLIVTKSTRHLSQVFEKGVWLAFLAAIGTALTSFMVGVSSQEISPLVSIWFSHGTLAIVALAYLLYKGEARSMASDIRKHPFTIACQSTFDNVAWVAFAFAATLIPVSIATTISGGYIALGVLLGIFVSRERVRKHQAAGIALVSVGIIALSYYFG